MSLDECRRMAASYLNKGDAAQAQAYATMGILIAISGAAPHHEHPEHEVAVRVALAAEAFFTQPSDTAFTEVSAALDAWQAVRGVTQVV